MSVIVLLAVGSDYNLLLVSRFKEEVGAGLKTGIIRAMAGTGAVVTSAGLVFAFTMASMAVSELRVIGQVGTTIGLGLLFRYPGGPIVHDAIHRSAARSLVLVAEHDPLETHRPGGAHTPGRSPNSAASAPGLICTSVP